MYRNEDREVKLLMDVARMYYCEGKNQSEISKAVNLSRSQISKLLTRAKELNIVTFSVHPPDYSSHVLREAVLDFFAPYGLQHCQVITDNRDPFRPNDWIFSEYALCLDRFLSRASVIGLGWGNYLYKICSKAENQCLKSSGTILPLCGSIPSPGYGYNTNELVRLYSAKYLLNPQYLYAPAFPLSDQEYKAFCSTDNYRSCFDMWSSMDTAVFRICNHPGSPDLGTGYRFGDMLEKSGAVGSFLGFYYDVNGKFITPEDDLYVGVSFEQLRSAKIRVGIVAQSNTGESIRGALCTGVISHLIITEDALLSLYNAISPN